MKIFLKKIKAVLFAAALFLPLFGEETPIQGLSSFTLGNGLELYVCEDHTVPLTYIEIAVRCGGISQTEETAGLFHLYEHMMFSGNKKYATPQDVQNELTNLGVASYNGSTTEDYVNYYFTIPSDKLEEGLNFWNYAIRTPTLDKKVFENEKKVVIAEIQGNANSIDELLNNITANVLFKEAPWVKKVGGTVLSVNKATIKQLKQIQKEFYIPNNSALFVGGDVNPEEVYALVNSIFGDWKAGKNPWDSRKHQFDKSPIRKPKYIAVSCDQLSEQMAVVQARYRGPDAEFDREDTILADTLLFATRDPKGYFKTALVNNQNLGIYDTEYCSFSYGTSRRMGVITAQAYMYAPEQYMPLRAKLFANELKDVLKGVLPVDNPLTEHNLELVHKYLYNENQYQQESYPTFLGVVRFWWACADTQYYYDYVKNVNDTTAADISEFIDRYLDNCSPLVIVLMNPKVLKACKAEFIESGYEVID